MFKKIKQRTERIKKEKQIQDEKQLEQNKYRKIYDVMDKIHHLHYYGKHGNLNDYITYNNFVEKIKKDNFSLIADHDDIEIGYRIRLFYNDIKVVEKLWCDFLIEFHYGEWFDIFIKLYNELDNMLKEELELKKIEKFKPLEDKKDNSNKFPSWINTDM